MKKLNLSNRKSEHGGVLAYTVMSALFLFLAVGLGVDLAHLYTVKAELQNAADAAALAGASALDLPADAKIPESADRAVTILNQNRYNFNNKTFVGGTPDLATLRTQLRPYLRYAVNLSEFDTGNGRTYAEAEAAPDDIRFIKVETPDSPVSIFFALPILGNERGLTASAVAGYSVPGNTTFCIFPLSAVSCDPGDANCLLQCRKSCEGSPDPNCIEEPSCKCNPAAADYPQPECNKYYGVCPQNAPGNFDPIPVEAGGLDPDGNGTCDPKREFCKSCTYSVRSEPSRGPAAGSYNIVQCGDATGNCVTRMALASYGACPCQAAAGQPLVTMNQPGQAAGPVSQGINVRFDMYHGCDPATDPTCEPGCQPNPTDHPPDKNVASPITYGQYSADPPNPFLAPPDHPPGENQRRVVIMPIIPIGQYTDGNGRQVVIPSGFGGFFIQQPAAQNSGEVKFEYIAEDIVDVIGFDPNDTNVTNVVTPVLYR